MEEEKEFEKEEEQDKEKETAPPPPQERPPSPRFRKPTKSFLNKRDRPETPVEPEMIYPPPPSVMKMTKTRSRYNALTSRQRRKLARSISPLWKPVKVFSPTAVRLPKVVKKRKRMPGYIKGDYRTMKVKDDGPKDLSFSEGSSESGFSDSSEEFQAPAARAKGFGEALPELHEIITAYRGMIDLSKV